MRGRLETPLYQFTPRNRVSGDFGTGHKCMNWRRPTPGHADASAPVIALLVFTCRAVVELGPQNWRGGGEGTTLHRGTGRGRKRRRSGGGNNGTPLPSCVCSRGPGETNIGGGHVIATPCTPTASTRGSWAEEGHPVRQGRRRGGSRGRPPVLPRGPGPGCPGPWMCA